MPYLDKNRSRSLLRHHKVHVSQIQKENGRCQYVCSAGAAEQSNSPISACYALVLGLAGSRVHRGHCGMAAPWEYVDEMKKMESFILQWYSVANPLVCHILLCFSLTVARACLGSIKLQTVHISPPARGISPKHLTKYCKCATL